MIDQQVFVTEFSILCDRFNRSFQEATLIRFYERLSLRLTTEEFKLACQTVFESCEFFPTVDQLVHSVKGNPEILALNEWTLLIQAVSRADNGFVSQMSAPGKFALQCLGGLAELGRIEESQIRFMRKEFTSIWVEVYKRNNLSAATPAKSEPVAQDISEQGISEEQRKQLEDLYKRMSI